LGKVLESRVEKAARISASRRKAVQNRILAGPPETARLGTQIAWYNVAARASGVRAAQPVEFDGGEDGSASRAKAVKTNQEATK
jgi:hypothetical protein